MEFHGRPRQVVLDYESNNERALIRQTLYRLGVPARVIEAHVAASQPPRTDGPQQRS